jgi:hypothetical protein
MVVKPTSEAAKRYLWFGRECLRLQATDIKAIKDGLNTIICKYTPDEAILIVTSKSGFLTHARKGIPRGFQFPGTDAAKTPASGLAHTGKGYTKTGAEIKDDGDFTGAQEGNPFPLIDGDAKTWLFEKPESDWKADGPQELVYGNVDWKGPDDPAERKILTYRGNPSRYWPVNQFVLIPGLSRIDHTIQSIKGDYSYTTVFSEFVYEKGAIRATMPLLYAPTNSGVQRAQVLGAAYDSDGKLVCIIKTCYINLPQDPQPPNGYYVELLVEGGPIEGWTRKLRIPFGSNMPNCNFFFSVDGSKACSVMFGQLHLIDVVAGTYTSETLGEFKNTISTTKTVAQENNPGRTVPGSEGTLFGGVFKEGINSGDWIGKTDTDETYQSAKSGAVVIAADYKGIELVKMTANLAGSETYHKKTLSGAKWGYTALPPTGVLGESGDAGRTPTISISVDPVDAFGTFTGGYCVEVTGACKPVISGPGSQIEGTNCFAWEGDACTSSGTFTLTVGVTDSVTGRTATHSKSYVGAVPALSISGPEDAIIGATYAAAGGVAPYSFSMSGGSISSMGVVDSLTCGPAGTSAMGLVIVTDSCNNAASLSVRLGSGHWQVVDNWSASGCVVDSDCIAGYIHVTGDTRTSDLVLGARFDDPSGCHSSLPPSSDRPCAEEVGPPERFFVVVQRETSKWVC